MYLPSLFSKLGNRPIGDRSRFLARFRPPFHVQPKLDGERVLIVKVGDRCLLVNRRGHWTDWLGSEFLEDGIYDGELLGLERGPQGVVKTPKDRLRLAVFDVVEPYGRLKLSERLEKLRKMVREDGRVEVVEDRVVSSFEEAEKLMEHYIGEGFEGAVVKADVPYFERGSWLKLKRSETIDAVIVAVKKTEGFLSYGVPEAFRVCYRGGMTDVSSGLSGEEKKALAGMLEPLMEDENYIWVKPRIVLEIEFQEMLKDGCLRHPRVKRIRWDKEVDRE